MKPAFFPRYYRSGLHLFAFQINFITTHIDIFHREGWIRKLSLWSLKLVKNCTLSAQRQSKKHLKFFRIFALLPSNSFSAANLPWINTTGWIVKWNGLLKYPTKVGVFQCPEVIRNSLTFREFLHFWHPDQQLDTRHSFFKINFLSSFESCGFKTVFQKELASPSSRTFTRSSNERKTAGSHWSIIPFYQRHHINFLFSWWIQTQRMTFQNEYQTFCLRDVASNIEIILGCKIVYISGRMCGRTFGQYNAFSFGLNLRRISSWAPREKSTMSVIFSLKLQKNTGNHQFILSGCGGCAKRFSLGIHEKHLDTTSRLFQQRSVHLVRASGHKIFCILRGTNFHPTVFSSW